MVTMTSKTIHLALYEQIPRFECIEGCTDCCGPVPWSDHELRAAGLERAPTEREDQVCEFSVKGGCAVYHARPLMCRLYGAVDDLRCPHGRGPLQLLSSEQAHDLVRRYKLHTGLT